MPIITAAITLNSTTLFPNSSTVNFSATEVVSGSALFQYTVVSASSNQIIYGPSAGADPTETVYFYAQAATTNPGNLTLSVTGSNTSGSSIIILRLVIGLISHSMSVVQDVLLEL